MSIARDFSLDAKYRLEEGVVFLSGIQALVRLPLDQHRADRRRGLNTATMISGYRGSPLGGLDLTLERNQPMLAEHHVVFISGVNEDLGATVVYGSQLANYFPQPKYDGVLGMWYGKAPGVDRTGDIFKHANFAGIAKNGGVLALAGDDPLSKSSTLPHRLRGRLLRCADAGALPGQRAGDPGLRPAGLRAVALFRPVGRVQDRHQRRRRDRHRRGRARPREHRRPALRWRRPPVAAHAEPDAAAALRPEIEREIYYGRLEAAKVFAAANGLNRVTLDTPEAWLGIVAAGKTYYDLRQALRELGLDDAALRRTASGS